MALRNIVTYGDPILKKICRSVVCFDDRLAQNLNDMYETLKKADGAGLAAPQIGILRRFCIVDAGDGLVELINPVIIETSGEQCGEEGCLSFPGEYARISRPMYVTVRAQDRYGKTFTVKGEGLKARAFCHELDHLDGIVFKDRIDKDAE